MQLSVLGDLSVQDTGRDITPRQGKLRTILALLALNEGKTVSTDAIIAEIWHGSPPDRALGTIHTYVYEIRKALDRRTRGDGGRILATRPNGYALDLQDVSFDFDRFELLVGEGSAQVSGTSEELERARSRFGEALALWRGEPLGNVPCGERLDRHVTWLEERRRQVLEMRLETDMRLGRFPELIGELKVLVERHPFHERFHELLMLALSRTGRRAEGLQVFQKLRERFTGELGLDPGPGVQRVHQELLAGEAESAAPPVRSTAEPIPRDSPDRRELRATLPPGIPDFRGREEEIARIREHLEHGDPRTGPAVCIHGMPGVGKTATAIHLAHLMAGRYPDGQIYIDLHDVAASLENGRRITADAVNALGVPRDEVPDTIEGCVGAFRALAADRRILLILDGVRSHQAIQKLVPARCATIITGRQPVYGIPGTLMTDLGPLPDEDAFELLSGIVGADRVRPEADAAYDIIGHVGALPLAVRFIGDRLALTPSLTVRRLRAKMIASGEDIRLSHLERIGLDLHSRLNATLDDLHQHERAAFRALAPLRHRTFSTTQAADLLGRGYLDTDLVLTTLADAGLLRITGDAADGDRLHGLHPMVALYAADCATEDHRPPTALTNGALS